MVDQHKYIFDVLSIISDYDAHEELWWKREDEKIKFFINCNDLFYWACADCVEITPDNIELLKQSFEDVDGYYQAPELFCCRVREMRPQGAYFKYIDQKYWNYFISCGPERERGMGNPHPPLTMEEYKKRTEKPKSFWEKLWSRKK